MAPPPVTGLGDCRDDGQYLLALQRPARARGTSGTGVRRSPAAPGRARPTPPSRPATGSTGPPAASLPRARAPGSHRPPTSSPTQVLGLEEGDRKSTRLNSSH